MKLKAIAVAALALFAAFATPARAIECDQLAGPPSNIGLCIPRYGTDFDQWSQAVSTAFALINSSAAIKGSTTAYNPLGWIAVNRISGMETGTPMIRFSSSAFFDSGTYLRLLGSGTVEGAGGLGVTYGISAGSGSFTGGVTASSFSASNASCANATCIGGGTGYNGGGSVATSAGKIATTDMAGNAVGLATSGLYMDTSFTNPTNHQIRMPNASSRIGVATAEPATSLDVNGNAQFGSGATKSTFTTTGALSLASGAALTISAGALADGTIYGQDIAASTIPLSKLNQSGCSTNEIPKWNGSAWACASDSAGSVLASTFTVMCNGDFAPAGTTQATEEALSGSTITMTTSAGTWVKVCWSATINISSEHGYLDLIVDGARPSFVGSNGTWKLGSFAASIDSHASGCANIRGLSAGSHSFSLMGWRGGNPLTIRRSNPCMHFSAEEK